MRMSRMITPALLLCGLLTAHPANAAMHWEPAPVDGAAAHGGHAGHGGGRNAARSAQMYRLVDGDGAGVNIWHPDLATEPAQLTDGIIHFPTDGMQFFHAILAERRSGNVVETAVRYVSAHGKPSKRSPSELLNAQKAVFEVVPWPIPREHWQYVAGDRHVFQVRFEGKPVAGAPLELRTENGTVLNAVSDQAGEAEFTLPDDFRDVKAGRALNKPADFTVAASYESGGTAYRGTFSAPYYVDPGHWQLFSYGATLIAVGLIAGAAGGRWMSHRAAVNMGKTKEGQA